MRPNIEDNLELYLAVIWKKLDAIERKVEGKGTRMAPIHAYLEDLEREVASVARQNR